MRDVSREPVRRLDGVGRNLLFLHLFNFLWSVGSPMVLGSTMIVSFFDHLGSPPIVIGSIQACMSLPVLVQFLPRLARLRTGGARRRMAAVYVASGVSFLAFGAVASSSARNPAHFIPLLLGMYFLTYCLLQLGAILYLDYLGRSLPADRIGRFYGLNGVLMAAGALAGTAAASRLLRVAAFPLDYGVLFLVAGALFVVSSLFSLFTRPLQAIEPRAVEPGVRAYGALLAGLLRRPAVRRTVALVVLVDLNLVGYGFALVYLNREAGRNVAPLSATLVAFASQAVLLPVFGHFMDKAGSVRTIRAYMAAALLADVAVLLPWGASFVPVFAVFGMSGLFLNLILVRLSGEAAPEDRMDVMILANVSGVFAASAASLAYGAVAGAVGSFRFVFVLSALCATATFLVPSGLRKREETPCPTSTTD